MESKYYEASAPAEAFAKASKDPAKWENDFAILEAFQAMAVALRDESTAAMQLGVDPICKCDRGMFRVAKKTKGFCIAIVAITGYEADIADPAAAEVLAFHRYNRGKALYAEQLLVYSQHIETIDQLDAAYALLEGLRLRPLIKRGGGVVRVKVGDNEFERPTFVVV